MLAVCAGVCVYIKITLKEEKIQKLEHSAKEREKDKNILIFFVLVHSKKDPASDVLCVRATNNSTNNKHL